MNDGADADPGADYVRLILYDRHEPGIGDSAVFARNWPVEMTPEMAADLFEGSFGEVDGTFRRTTRDDPDACYDVFEPPAGFPVFEEPDRDGTTRKPIIEKVLRECKFVVSLKIIAG